MQNLDSDDELIKNVQLSPRFSLTQSPRLIPRDPSGKDDHEFEETIGSLRDAYLDESMNCTSLTPVIKHMPERKKSEKLLSTASSQASFTGIENLLENNRKWAATMVLRNPNFFSKLVKQQTPQVLWIGWYIMSSFNVIDLTGI